MHWKKTWSLTALLFLSMLTFNEYILRIAGHQPSVNDNNDLFCLEYSKVPTLGTNDVILLGASRMQTNVDLDTFRNRYPKSRILNLAQSGSGTAFPVLSAIVENTDFAGTVLISETETTLISKTQTQAPTIDYCQQNFSLSKKVDRLIKNWLETRLTLLNSFGSSTRIWGNLLYKQELPEPMYVQIDTERSAKSDFSRAMPSELRRLYEERTNGAYNLLGNWDMSPETWLLRTQHWSETINTFQERGGLVIFIRMPVSLERWAYESEAFPVSNYWMRFVDTKNVPSIHFSTHQELSNYILPDASHLDVKDRQEFTDRLLEKLQSELDLDNS